MDDDGDNELIQNALLFIRARQNKPTEDKIKNIATVLSDGADINTQDANNNNNTILHIATEKGEKDVVEFLIKNGAMLLYNLDNKTPMHIAKEKKTEIGEELLKILNKGKQLPTIERASKDQRMQSYQNRAISQVTEISSPKILYQKRAGTSGVSGQFYETKLLSLVLHRALHDKDIEEFYLATNIRDIGDFDDVCFRFKMQEGDRSKHVVCFKQAKHREVTDKAKLTVARIRGTSGQFSLARYFDSYLKIKQKFLKKSKVLDPMFEGEFSDIDCYFIFYTPLQESFDRKLVGNKPICDKLHQLIFTGDKDEVFQFDYEDSDIDFLTNFMQKERVKALGTAFLTCILSNKQNEIMSIDLIQLYHPALAQLVIEEIFRKKSSFEAKFRDEFFKSDDEILVSLKETFYKIIVFKQSKKTKLSKEEVKDKIEQIVRNPCAQTISELIGDVIYFDDKNSKLSVDTDKISKKHYKQEELREINHYLNKINVTQAIVSEAVNICGKNKLNKLRFTLPNTFGNTDFPSNFNEEVPTDRLKFLANKFSELIKDGKTRLEENEENNNEEQVKYPIVIDICNRNVGPKKILELNHLTTKGIGGTVGNLLQYDKQTQTFAFNTNENTLGKNSKYMLKEIKELIKDDLANYRFNVKMNSFPRTCFDTNENDRDLAKEYLSKLWFYTNQAQEDAVEDKLKAEIDAHYNSNKNENQFLFRVHSDAIFLRFHDEVQKWWKSQSQARYLTKTDSIFDEAKKDIINSPVLTVLNVMFIRSFKKLAIEFNKNAIKAMNLDEMIENNTIINVTTDAVILSAAKIMQLVDNKNNYTFVNLDYFQILPDNDYLQLMDELREMKPVTLVILCETSLDEKHEDTLQKILDNYNGTIIIITEKELDEKFSQDTKRIVFNDKNVNLTDLCPKSQTKVLNDYKICYQGKDVTLNSLKLSDKSKYRINAKLLWSILNNNKIEIGHSLDSHKYNEIKKYYIHRNLIKDDEEIIVNTFNDIDDKVVLITSKPCMGKTILLTHLALETKKIDPAPWIVRINMSLYTNDYTKWQKHVNTNDVMRFLCKVALKTTIDVSQLRFTELDDETVELDRTSLKEIPAELEWFIHFYNEGKVILLFDGFDTIYPHHTKEGLELLVALKRANKRMWITSNCYTKKILEYQLGSSYTLERLSTIQQESFLNRFWKTNLKLEKLNHEQFNNINMFINYISKIFDPKGKSLNEDRPFVPLLSMPLHLIYLTIVEHFKNEINSLSSMFMAEKIKDKWNLNNYTVMDDFLRNPEEEHRLELAGTPLHMYIAANYFKFQITDKFELTLNTEEISKRSAVFIDALTSYQCFLKANIKQICETGDKNVVTEQEKLRDEFFETHKKLALYAICREKDISKLLTESEIRQVKGIIKKLESGEMKSYLIDCVVDGVPRFYNYLFAEYFIVEQATDLLKAVVRGDIHDISLESCWNFVVNCVILLCPPGVRNAFDYKLKYDPEMAEIANQERSQKILFELILKQKEESEATGNAETCLKIAINDGLVNITNLLLRSTRKYVTRENVDGIVGIIKTGAFVLGAANPSWKELTENMTNCIHNVDGERLISILNGDEVDGVSQAITKLCLSTEKGKELQEKIKKHICEPIKEFADSVVKDSGNENLKSLKELLPQHLPSIVNALFGKK